MRPLLIAAAVHRLIMESTVHVWEEEEELLLHNIQSNAVYQLNPVGGIVKLQ